MVDDVAGRRVTLKSQVVTQYVWSALSRNRLEIQTELGYTFRLQWSTYGKQHLGYQITTCPMT